MKYFGRTRANAVKVTMGPKGKLVLIHRPGQHPVVTKDGVRYIAQVPESEIHYTDTDPDTLGEL